MTMPVLWSFRRCPFAIRARLALASAGVAVEHREILLRDKPEAFLAASPAGTVPVLEGADRVLVHSRDIMLWALGQNDPERLLNQPSGATDLIDQADGSFKNALDRYKYHVRHSGVNPKAERAICMAWLGDLADIMDKNEWVFGTSPRLADLAILPFVRQFAHVDLLWFEATAPPAILAWLNRFKASERFAKVMVKHPLWQTTGP